MLAEASFLETVKTFHVTSTDTKPTPLIQQQGGTPGDRTTPASSTRKMPHNRSGVGSDDDYTPTEGLLTAAQMTAFFSRYAANPHAHTPDALATEYKIDPAVARNLLKFYAIKV